MVKASKLAAAAARIGALLDMFLLQLIHDLANGKYVDSPRDAKQLARLAAAMRDAFMTCHSEDDTLCADNVASMRVQIKKVVPMMASCEATYEEREQLIEELKAKIELARRVTRCLRRLKEHDAEAEAAKAKCEEQWKRLREDDKRYRELMESGERFRKYRKQAQEGDAEAAAFFESVGWPVTEPAECCLVFRIDGRCIVCNNVL